VGVYPAVVPPWLGVTLYHYRGNPIALWISIGKCLSARETQFLSQTTLFGKVLIWTRQPTGFTRSGLLDFSRSNFEYRIFSVWFLMQFDVSFLTFIKNPARGKNLKNNKVSQWIHLYCWWNSLWSSSFILTYNMKIFRVSSRDILGFQHDYVSRKCEIVTWIKFHDYATK